MFPQISHTYIWLELFALIGSENYSAQSISGLFPDGSGKKWDINQQEGYGEGIAVDFHAKEHDHWQRVGTIVRIVISVRWGSDQLGPYGD